MIKAVFFDWVGTLAHPEPDSQCPAGWGKEEKRK